MVEQKCFSDLAKVYLDYGQKIEEIKRSFEENRESYYTILGNQFIQLSGLNDFSISSQKDSKWLNIKYAGTDSYLALKDSSIYFVFDFNPVGWPYLNYKIGFSFLKDDKKAIEDKNIEAFLVSHIKECWPKNQNNRQVIIDSKISGWSGLGKTGSYYEIFFKKEVMYWPFEDLAEMTCKIIECVVPYLRK